jgi:hypothetical protein
MIQNRISALLIALGLLLTGNPLYAEDDSATFAEKLMVHQLEALKRGDLQAFVKNGNEAFKQFTDEYSFDSLKMQRQDEVARGYRLEYLGKIDRRRLWEHLWKVHIEHANFERLGSLSLSHGKVVGFDLH